MKPQSVLITIAVTAVCNCCTTEDYYRSANKNAELFSSINLSAIDTIKTGEKSLQSTYILPIAASDENGNMNLLTTSADGGKTQIIDGLGDGANEAIELATERYTFTRKVEFTPAVDGRHAISIWVRDDFGNVTSLTKNVYSFTNMQPKLKFGYYAERYNSWDVIHKIDFRASYDRDSKWGGDIDSLFCLHKAIGYADIDAEATKILVGVKVNDPLNLIHTDTYEIEALLPDQDGEWYTDVWIWVKDNENMPSDTVHISIGHIENSVARQEYEGR
jgi:hypothetical protein